MAADTFSTILLNDGIVSDEQLADAVKAATSSGKQLHEEVLRLGYGKSDVVMRALAKAHRLPYIDVAAIDVPQSIVDRLPESVARENSIFPIEQEGDSLRIATRDPTDLDIQEKLRFILNSNVDLSVAPRDQIVEAINRHYGIIDGESGDSMLQEFTNTAIDFTETTVEEQARQEALRQRQREHQRLEDLALRRRRAAGMAQAAEELRFREEQARLEAEAQARQAELLRQEASQIRKEAAERAAQEAQERAREQARREAEALRRAQAEAAALRASQEAARQAAEERAREAAEAEAERRVARIAREASEAAARQAAEERTRREAEERAIAHAADMDRIAREDAAQRQEAERLHRLEEERARLADLSRSGKEAAERARLATEAEARREAARRSRLEAEAARRRALVEASEQAEAAERLKLADEARARAQAEER